MFRRFGKRSMHRSLLEKHSNPPHLLFEPKNELSDAESSFFLIESNSCTEASDVPSSNIGGTVSL
jgi:hypothetical protein